MKQRVQSPAEERANCLIHGFGALAAVAAIPILLGHAMRLGNARGMVGACIFLATMFLLYATSTLYHGLTGSKVRHIFLKMDNAAIYLFIAGTYTPFALGAPGSPRGWALFALVWAVAALGATLKATGRLAQPWLSTLLYVAMGWLVLIAAVPLVAYVRLTGVMLLAAGGLAYTVGVVFFILDSRYRYSHALWHCFVIAGTGCHFCAVLSCAV